MRRCSVVTNPDTGNLAANADVVLDQDSIVASVGRDLRAWLTLGADSGPPASLAAFRKRMGRVAGTAEAWRKNLTHGRIMKSWS